MRAEAELGGDNGKCADALGSASGVTEPELAAEESIDGAQSPSDRTSHPDYVPTRAVRVRIVLLSGTRCIGGIHVRHPDGRVSDVLNDDREFLPLTEVALEGDHTAYDFLTVNKSQIAMIYEIRRS